MTEIEKAERYRVEADDAEKSGDLAMAVEQMKEALKLRPDFTRYWVILGNLYRTWRKFQESEDAIRKGIEINPSASYAWSELGLLYKDRRLYEKAAVFLSRSVQLRPDFNTYTILAAVVLMFDANAALLHAEKALEMNPEWDEALKVRDKAKKARGLREDN